MEYRTLSALFGVGRSTVGLIVVETCQAIATHLLPRHVQIPQGEHLKEIVDGFETCWGFPQVAGAIDGSHIPILLPDQSASDYYNRKGYYSVIMQAMVDIRGLFMDVYIGWPGKFTMPGFLSILHYITRDGWYTISRLEKKHFWSRGMYIFCKRGS